MIYDLFQAIMNDINAIMYNINDIMDAKRVILWMTKNNILHKADGLLVRDGII